MRLLIALTLLLSSSIHLIAQDPITLESKGLKGDIAEWTSFRYTEDSSEVWLIDKHSFDTEGRLYRLESFNRGRNVGLEETTYNSIGKIAQIKMTSNSRGVRLKKFEYDSLKRPIRMEIISVGDSLPHFIKTWEYSETWRIEEKSGEAGSFINKHIFYPNEMGKDTLVIKKNGKGEVIGKAQYTYDFKGRYLTRFSYEKYTAYQEVDTFFNVIKYPNDSTEVLRYYKNSVEDSYYKMIYDANKELIYYKEIEPKEEIDAEMTYTLIYDKQDNLIQKIRFNWGIYDGMDKFEIVYRKK